MKINKHELDEAQIGEFDSIDSTIAEKDMGLAMTMVSKNLYSNPIGSFIRELVSNAVDANVDAKVNNPIRVNIYPDDGTYYIDVIDNGTGISPENFKNIYMSWFNSDKRDTNTKIGGWGLGSKSPFAYQDAFEIITVVDNTKYHYIFANEQPKPKATLILEEYTTEPNGTTIRIEIKEEDTYKVHRECKNQLVYFDNVYVTNELYFYDNTFKIYEAEHFKLRNKDFPFGEEMHLCIGQVAYPINWNVLGIERVNIPVGIKFNIGELEVTLSREEIAYTPEVKEKIINKVTIVEADLIDRYEKQLKVKDLFDYVIMVKDKVKPPLVIQDVKIPMTNIKSSVYFPILDNIKIKADDISLLFSAYNVTQIKGGKNFPLKSDSYKQYFNLYRNTHNCYYMTKDINYFDSLYINNGWLFKKGKLTSFRYKTIARLLNLTIETPLKYGKNKVGYKTGSAIIIHKVLRYIDEYLKTKIAMYEGTAPADWVQAQKDAAAQKKEDTKGTITYYNIYNNRSQIKLKNLIEQNKVIFYIIKTEQAKKLVAYNILYDLGNKNFKKQSTFIIVSPTVASIIKKFKNVHHASSIFKVNSYKNLLYKLRLSRFVENYLKEYKYLFSVYSTNAYKKCLEITKYYNIQHIYSKSQVPIDSKTKQTIYIDLCSYFRKELKAIKRTKNRQYLLYETEIVPLIRLGKKLKFLEYFKSSTPHSIIVHFVQKLKILGIDKKYYNKHYKH